MNSRPPGTGSRPSTNGIDLGSLEEAAAEESARARSAADRDVEAAASRSTLKPSVAPAGTGPETNPAPKAKPQPKPRAAKPKPTAGPAFAGSAPAGQASGGSGSVEPASEQPASTEPAAGTGKPTPAKRRPAAKRATRSRAARPKAAQPQTTEPSTAQPPTVEPLTAEDARQIAEPSVVIADLITSAGQTVPAREDQLTGDTTPEQAVTAKAAAGPEAVTNAKAAADSEAVADSAAAADAEHAAGSEHAADSELADNPEPATAAQASGGLHDLLADVLVGEPPLGEGVAAVYRRAEKLRRRRLRRVVAAGVVSALVVAGFGFALATAVIPVTRHPGLDPHPVAVPEPAVDPVLVALGPVLSNNGLKATPKEPSAGPGWRQYSVVDRTSGRPRGLIEVAAYAAPDGLCFPVLGDAEACARPMSRGDDFEYVRYTDDRDVDWQVHEAIGRRLSDGRVLAVMATGERGTGKRVDGRPPMNAAEVAALSVDKRAMAAFAPGEACAEPDPACPVLKVPVVTG